MDRSAQRMSLVAPLVRTRMANAFFAYSTNYLIDTDNAVIVDAEATRSIRQASVGSVRKMLDRVKDTIELHPEQVITPTH